MEDFDMYISGWLNPDESEQWDHVTEMMATASPHRGSDCQWEDTGDDEPDFIGPCRPYIPEEDIPY